MTRVKIAVMLVVTIIISVAITYFFYVSRKQKLEHFQTSDPINFDTVLDKYCTDHTNKNDYVWGENICEYKPCDDDQCVKLIPDDGSTAVEEHINIYKYQQFPVPMQIKDHKCTPGLNNDPQSDIYCYPAESRF